jgi:hypothetical protein
MPFKLRNLASCDSQKRACRDALNPCGEVTHRRLKDVKFGDRSVSQVEKHLDNEDKKTTHTQAFMKWG